MPSISLISESSQEVSQYMNSLTSEQGGREKGYSVCEREPEGERERENQFISSSQVPPTTSAGYSRLKRGIRGVSIITAETTPRPRPKD